MTHPHAAAVAAELASLVNQLPQLQVLEITFWLPGVVAALKDTLKQQQIDTELGWSDSIGQGILQRHLYVLELTVFDSLSTAHRLLRDVNAKQSVSAGSSGLDQAAWRMLLEAAANCSTPAKHTPLHAAVDQHNPAAVRVSDALREVLLSAHLCKS